MNEKPDTDSAASRRGASAGSVPLVLAVDTLSRRWESKANQLRASAIRLQGCHPETRGIETLLEEVADIYGQCAKEMRELFSPNMKDHAHE